MSVVTVIIVVIAFISGIFVGRDLESKLWLNDYMNKFVETNRLQSENDYLKKKLGMIDITEETE